MTRYIFKENNSGGKWWLERKQYEALFQEGWTYEPSEWDLEMEHDKNPFLGGDVPYGWRSHMVGDFTTLKEAVESFERATGENFFAEGCNCCGCPFFISTEDYKESISGDLVQRNVIRPW